MIVNYKHKFIFLKAHKVGGTSVEMALSTLCDGDDIVTPITPVDELARLKMGGRPRNFASTRMKERAYIRAVRSASPEELPNISAGKLRFSNHMPLARIEKKINIDGMRRIGVVRSPYGMVVSAANHRINFDTYKQTGLKMTATPDQIRSKVDAAIRKNGLRGRCLCESYRSMNGQVQIEPLHQERLQDDLTNFLATLDLPAIELPQAKAGLGLSARECADLLRADQRAVVAEAFAEDIAVFGDGLDR